MPQCPHCNKELQVRIEVLSGSGYHDVDQFYKDDAPAPSPAPEKVILWDDGDEWRFGDYLWHVRGNSGWMIDEDIGPHSDFAASRNDPHFKPISQLQGDAKAEQLGFAVRRTAKVEPTRAVFEFLAGDVVTRGTSNYFLWRDGKWAYFNHAPDFVRPVVFGGGTYRSPAEVDLTREQIIAHLDKHGWDAKFPDDTPASDSVKGERDRHGRSIIARNDFAMVVESENVEWPYVVSDESGELFFSSIGWSKSHSRLFHKTELRLAMQLLAEAAATPLPAAASLETPKVDDDSEDRIRGLEAKWAKLPANSPESEILFDVVIDLKREIAALKRDLAELREATK